MSDNNDIMVSVCCLVFNHEKYLRKCLDGFIKQKTNFKYEVLIHDDASTDRSADIIREYEKEYPDIIKPIYQTENQFSKGIHIWWKYQFPICSGKYIALCEGDDYWTDEYKLQKQFNALEKHTDCVFCAHRVGYIKEDGCLMNKSLPYIRLSNGVIKSKKWIKHIFTTTYLFQTSSYFFRKKNMEKFFYKMPVFLTVSKVGDVPLMLLMASEGNCFYMDDNMSRYRIHSKSSWTSKMSDSKFAIDAKISGLRMLKEFDRYTNHKYSNYVEYNINLVKLTLEFSKNNYKAIFYKKFKPIYKSFPCKRKLVYLIYALFPFVRKIYLRIVYR